MREIGFNGVDIIDSALVIPSAAEPATETPPDITCMVAWVAWHGRRILQIGCPSFVAGTDNSICILGVERCIIAAHGPCALKNRELYLENTIALITSSSIPRFRWARARIRRPVTALTLVPVGFSYGLRSHDVLIYAPLACNPLENLVRCARKVTCYLLAQPIRLTTNADPGTPGRQLRDLLCSRHPVVCCKVFWPRLP